MNLALEVHPLYSPEARTLREDGHDSFWQRTLRLLSLLSEPDSRVFTLTEVRYNARWTMPPHLPPEVADFVDIRGFMLKESRKTREEVDQAVKPLIEYWKKHAHGKYQVEYAIVEVKKQ